VRTNLIKARALGGMLALGLAFGLLAPQPTQAVTEMTATENLNVRVAPKTTADIVGGLYRGQTVKAVGSTMGWTKISFGGTTAYVASTYLSAGSDLPISSKVDAGTIKITTAPLNLRKGPGLSYDVLKVLAKGTRVTLTGKTARGFAELVNGTSTGWASTQYLAKSRSGLPEIIGTRVATTALDIRTTSGADSKTVAEVKKGTVLSVTGATQNGRAQIVYKKAVRWVTARYLATPSNNLPQPPRLPKIAGYRYATVALDIRSTYADKYTAISEVPRGTKLAITTVVKKARRQIVYENAVRWVTKKYLSKTKPKVGTTPKYAVEKGLKPNAIKVHRAILAEFPEITVFGGVHPDPLPDHPSGRALDCMIPNYKSKHGRALGFALSRWARANADRLGVNYVIWDQHIWNNQRASEGWRYMAGRGSDSANHKNHVHITVYAKGYSPV
jgi:uncharacterized protein YgiM (DUF1202 family)